MALGVNDTFYQHCEAFPIYGMGQGSMNSPIIWLIISSTPFVIHKELGNGVTFYNTPQQVEVHITVVGFVNDTTGQANDFQNNH
eukprot:11655218-Ditylum_brightwellii.AAC.1